LEGELRKWGWQGPVWKLRRRMDVPRIEGEVVAFCGIARPEQFFLGLEQAGVRIAERVVFRDHHRYTKADWQRLDNALRRTQARMLMTTEKDLVRLGALADNLPLLTVPLRTEIEDEASALDWLMGRIHGAR
jgi:tetraacyldisaccharide 4'-kinase